MNRQTTVVVIDDEPQMRKLLAITLEGAGFKVRESGNGHLGMHEVALGRPEAIVVDLGLPDMDGIDVVRRLREWSKTPILVLSVRDATDQKVAALEAGADDYLTKPFDGTELIARLRALLRRAQTEVGSPVFVCGQLQLDYVAHTVKVFGREIHLTQTEYALLAMLATHAGRVLTHEHMLRTIWGPNAAEQRQYLRVHLGSLRSKLEGAVVIRTEPGVGYRLLQDAVGT
jgi:two-component system, OmpR family, KDP operon response regulator KdpE